jgi:hypothetical protein
MAIIFYYLKKLQKTIHRKWIGTFLGHAIAINGAHSETASRLKGRQCATQYNTQPMKKNTIFPLNVLAKVDTYMAWLIPSESWNLHSTSFVGKISSNSTLQII